MVIMEQHSYVSGSCSSGPHADHRQACCTHNGMMNLHNHHSRSNVNPNRIIVTTPIMIFSKCVGRDKRYAEYYTVPSYYARRNAGASSCFPAQADRGSSSQPFTRNPSRDNGRYSTTAVFSKPFCLRTPIGFKK